MKISNAVLTVLLALVLSPGMAMAQHDHAAMTDDPAQSKPSSDSMMKSCQKHGSETMAALDKLEKTIAAGRESKDAATMKEALDTAQKQLAEAKHHMSMCPMMSQGSMQHDGIDHMNGMPEGSEQH